MAGLKVLSALDSTKTQLYHFKAIVVAGMGLFTDAYDLFCLSPVLRLLGGIYYHDRPKHEIPASLTSAMVSTPLVGTAIGQLVFGYLGDRVGRRRIYGLSLMLMVVGSLMCGLSIGTSRARVMLSLVFFRFVLGLGIGGDYPLSATIMSEFANRKTRGAFIAAVFSMQGFGILMSSAVTMGVCTAFDRATRESPGHAADLAWRVILMIGALPAGLTYYWRMMMPETARYTALVERNVEQATKDMAKIMSVSLFQIAEEVELEEQVSPIYATPPISNDNNYSLLSKQFLRRHGRDLFACTTCWFLVDVVFYSCNLFQSHIYKNTPRQELNAFQEAFHVARLQAIVAVCSTIPGYYATVYFIDRVGRFKIQAMGFLFMALILFAIGIPYNRFWHANVKVAFWILGSLTFFFANFGPNTTTFIVPAELFPARLRSTCHGISGAAGKIGAIIGSVGFLWASHNENENGYHKGIGMQATLVILGGVCIVGMIVTYFFTFETKERSLEENEKDDDQNNGACFVRCITGFPCIGAQSAGNNSL